MVVVITIYKYIKPTHCTPSMYTMFYDNYNSTENEKIKDYYGF